MKKKLLMLLTLAILLVGCGDKEGTDNTIADNQTTTETPSTNEATTNQSSTPEVPTPTEDVTTPEEPTEPPHEHAYTESTTTEATCEADGVKTFTCDCGDSYTEVITAAGHNFAEYISNNDATYMADGTETATCICGLTDTRTAEGSKLELPAEPNMYGMELTTTGYSDPNKLWYVMEDTDLYFEPSFQSPIIGHLSINDTIKIINKTDNYVESEKTWLPYSKTESPTEVYWAYVDFNGQRGFIPDDYYGRKERDMSVTLNPLAVNYPLVGGGANTTIFPYAGMGWRYMYGATMSSTVTLNTHYSSVDIYDGIDRNVIATITDANTKFQLTGSAYVTYRDDVASYYIYEIYYNDGVAYIDSLQSQQWN